MAGTPRHNGRVRKQKNLLEVASVLKILAPSPKRFWRDCLLYNTSLINKLPSSVLGWKTPHEVMFTRKAQYGGIKVFECLCYGKTKGTRIRNLVKEQRDVIS